MREEGRISNYPYVLSTDQEQALPSRMKMDRFKCKKPSQKVIYIISGCFLACLLIAIVLAIVFSLKKSDDCPPGAHCDWKALPPAEFLKDERCEDICSTRSCLESADYMLKRIDPTQDPCEDFYQFACGTFIKEAQRYPDRLDTVKSTVQELESSFIQDLRDVLEDIPVNITGSKQGAALRFAKTFYTNCLADNEGIFLRRSKIFLQELFHPDGQLPWPLISQESFTSSNPPLESMLAFLNMVLSNPLFQAVLIHEGRSSWRIELLVPLVSEIEVFNFQNPESHHRKKYRDIFGHVLFELGVEEKEVDSIMREYVSFDNKIISEAVKQMDKEDVYRETKKFSCRELQNKLRSLDWCKFASNLLLHFGVSPNIAVSFTTEHFQYLQAINRIIETTIDEVLVNYLNIKFIANFQKFLPGLFQYLYYAIDDDVIWKDRIYKSASTPRERCALITVEQLWLVLYDTYMQEKFDPSKRKKVEEIYMQMNSSMQEFIENADWLSDEAKQILFLENDLKYVWREDAIPSQDELDEMFSMMPIKSTSLIETALELMKLKQKLTLSFKNHWLLFEDLFFFYDHMHHSSINNNPYGLKYFRFPVLEFDRPKYLEYSTLGAVMAYPITKWFYLREKNTENFTKEIEEKHDEIRKCLFEEFSIYDEVNNDKNLTDIDLLNDVNEVLTLEISYKVYQENVDEKEMGLPGLPLTKEQLFFLSYAQLNCEYQDPYNKKFVMYNGHEFVGISPVKRRVNGPLSQSVEFAEAFRCSPGSPMNPITKCCILKPLEGDYKCK